MNRFKKACEELTVYLNKDVKGIGLLLRITKIGNEVRNELNAVTDAKERSDSTCKIHFDAAAKAASESSKANAERQQHLDTIASLRCKVATYEKQAVQENKEPVSETLVITPKEVSRLVRDAMNDRQHLNSVMYDDKMIKSRPAMNNVMDSMAGVTDKLAFIKLNGSIKNLSYTELAKLGRLVALYAIMQGHAVVTSDRFSSLYDPDNPETEAVEAANRLFIRFMKPRCDFSEDYRKEAMYQGSKSQVIAKPGV